MLPSYLGLEVYKVFQVSAYPPAIFVEGVCKAQQAREDDIVSIPFSREGEARKEKEEREQCKYGTYAFKLTRRFNLWFQNLWR